MHRQTLLLSISAFMFCVLSASVSHAVPSSITIADSQSTSEEASSNRLALVRQFIQAIESKDARIIDQLLADNVVLEQPYSPEQPGGVRVEGKQIASLFFDRIFREFSQIRFVDVVFRQSQFDNTVIVEARGDFRLAADQSPYRNQYIAVIEVVDGQITLIREYFNPLLLPREPGS
ncbi:MAG: nuclear transport factor 2 family protein [Oculatellaceae cyanobacterium bins.114]|nr:nuclear transport factor 2 family protein [Oculatellaceae cyanobacterium bins.114]